MPLSARIAAGMILSQQTFPWRGCERLRWTNLSVIRSAGIPRSAGEIRHRHGGVGRRPVPHPISWTSREGASVVGTRLRMNRTGICAATIQPVARRDIERARSINRSGEPRESLDGPARRLRVVRTRRW